MIYAMGLLPLLLLLLGFPIYLVLLSACTAALVFVMNIPLAALHQNLFAGVNAFSLLAVPFFIYAGELMGRGSVAERLVDLMQDGIGRTPGSLGLTTVGTTAVFGAISGASAATVATVGRIMYPAMLKAGYPATFSAGLVTAVGAIDIVIPPSVPMIVYGLASNESVPRLYAAGFLPGLLIAGLLAAYVTWYARRRKLVSGDAFSFRRFLRSARRAAWALGAPFIILGGIYGGVFSPTESAAVACVFAVLVTRLVYRELSWSDVLDAASSTVMFTGQVMVIIACANAFAWILTVHQVPASLVSWVELLKVPPWLLLLTINVLLLLAGCFLDPLSAILMLGPLMLPVVVAAGFDPVHFGIVVMVNLAIGLFHPPFGLNIFVAQSVLGIPLGTLYRGILPFLVVYFVALMLISYLPEISLIGPRLLFGN